MSGSTNFRTAVHGERYDEQSPERTGNRLETPKAQPPLVVHIIHRLAVGGLENGLVNLINHMPQERYRHAIVTLTDFTEFRNRILRTDVPVIALHKRAGVEFRAHRRLWRVLRALRPAVVHTRNLPALEFLVVAAFAGVSARIHGEHGRDMHDIDGSNRKYNLLRKAINPFVSHYTAVSEDLTHWLMRTIGVGTDKVKHICNGVDIHWFHPQVEARLHLGPKGFIHQDTVVVGTVGRMQTVKDQLTLVRAFVHLIGHDAQARQRLRLVMIGDGPLRDKCRTLLRDSGAEELAWLPGERSDIPEIMRALDIFVLPSVAEGISNTILEAMASGLPVVATSVGGNHELVREGETGFLVPAAHPPAMADAIRSYLVDRGQACSHGAAGRKRVETLFSINTMVRGYMDIYDSVLNGRSRLPQTVSS
jgi:sugar transferase (PEP-CTERM/EpsH1 system associated)